MEQATATPEAGAPTEVTEQPIVDKAGGDGITSFDELETVESTQQRNKELKSEVADKPNKGGKSKKGDGPDKESQEVKNKDVEQEDSVDESVDDSLAELPEVNSFKVKNGHDEVSLRADTAVPVKIDGQVHEIPLQEVINGYSGQSSLQRQYQEFKEAESKYVADKETVDSTLGEIFSTAEADPTAALFKLAEYQGLDPVKFQMNLMNSLSEQAEKWNNMSESEQLAYETQLQNQHLLAQNERLNTQQASAKEMNELDTQVQQVEEQLGVNREQFAEAYHDLQNMMQEAGVDTEIEINDVVNFIQEAHYIDYAQGVLKTLGDDLATDEEAVNSMVDIMQAHPDWSDEDYLEVAQEAFKTQKAQKLTNKLAQGKPDRVSKRTETDPQKAPLSFSELDAKF